MHKIVITLSILLLGWPGTSVLSSIVPSFQIETIPAGYKVDVANVLGTVSLSPGDGHDTLCCMLCRIARTCLGFLVQDGSCNLYAKLSTVADASVRKCYSRK